MLKKLLIALIIVSSMFSTKVYCSEDLIPAISNTYTEGFYRFDNTKTVNINVTLTTDTLTKMMIFDENLGLQYFSILPVKEKFTLRNIEPNRIICIIGEGEVALTFEY